MVKEFVQAWAARLAQHRRGAQRPAGVEIPNIVADGTDITPSAGSYDDWTKRFIAFTDHAAVIARTSSLPAVVEVGHSLDRLCADLNESLDEMGPWRPLPWPAWPDSAIGIDGTLKMFEMLKKLLSTLTRDSASGSDPLETAWNAATLDLFEELEQLKAQYIASVRR